MIRIKRVRPTMSRGLWCGNCQRRVKEECDGGALGFVMRVRRVNSSDSSSLCAEYAFSCFLILSRLNYVDARFLMQLQTRKGSLYQRGTLEV